MASKIGNQNRRKLTAVDGWRKITFEKTHLKSGSGLEEMSDSRWTEKITFEKTHLKSGTGIRKNERQSMDGENDFCFLEQIKTEDQLRGSVKRK